ncbi:MAG TPA: ATP-binding protein [Pseudomonadales bacterium]
MRESVEAVLYTEELQMLPQRSPDLAAEVRALGILVHTFAETPDRILQVLTDTLLDTFHVGSAGYSLLLDGDDGPTLTWPALAGDWKTCLDRNPPWHVSPCDEVRARNTPLLFRRPQRHYAHLHAISPAIEECLLVPFGPTGASAGALWLVSHDPARKFDGEDLRQLLVLGEFASAAYQAVNLANRLRSINESLLLGVVRQHESVEAEEELNLLLRGEIAECRESESQLQQATLNATRASLSKSDFLTNMSHELRTPLVSILGHAQVIELGAELTDKQKLGITQIQKAGWHLADLINDVLDLAQVEAGKLSVRMDAVPLAEVLLECQAMMEPLAVARRITMSFTGAESGVWVRGDRKRIKQVMINLLSNAIKYNRLNGTVTVECHDCADNVRISVADAGEGLTETQLSQLFQLFNRLGQDALNVNGTGIGLVMTKRLAELMGGTVCAQSTVGVGSVFWIELQREAAPQPLPVSPVPVYPSAVSAGTAQKTLLYVEDNASNLLMVQELMSRRDDIHLLSAHDGKEGIAVARARHPDAILLDIRLPDISGLDVAAILASDPATAGIPLIGCSAQAMPQDVSRAMDAGFFHYLVKPISVSELMGTVDLALGIARP